MSDRQLLFDREVPKGWQLLKVDELKADEHASCSAGPFGSNISSKYFVDEGIPVIRGANLRNDLTQFVPEGFVFVSPERAAKHYKGQHVRAGDLVFTCWGTLGQVGLIPKNGPFPAYIISNKQLKFRPNTELADPLYLFYYFACREMVNHINSIAIGAAVPGINLGILKNLDVVLPPLPLQRKIASILSAYDDLIENNTRRIAILEEMAQAIYREWFVNFRFPGHENVKLVDSPIGQIPEGWESKQLCEIADTRLGKMLDAKKNKGELMPYLANLNVRWGGIDLQDLREMKFEAKEHEKYGLKYGDIVMCEGGEPGRCAIWMEQVPNMMLQKAIHRIRSHGGVNFRFLYHSLRHIGQSGELESLFTGATIKHLPSEKLKIVTLVVPSTSRMELFSQMVEPMISQVDVLAKRNSILRQTRDLLLPKLISGKLDVEDIDLDLGMTAEALVEATA